METTDCAHTTTRHSRLHICTKYVLVRLSYAHTLLDMHRRGKSPTWDTLLAVKSNVNTAGLATEDPVKHSTCGATAAAAEA